jgi:hypothetical protein
VAGSLDVDFRRFPPSRLLAPSRAAATGEFSPRRRSAVSEALAVHRQARFFFSVAFFTGGDRKNRLPRILGNLGFFSTEFFQTNFEFKKFWHQTNKFLA